MNEDIRSNPLYWEKDPKKKKYQYAHEMCSVFRRQMKCIVDKDTAAKGMAYLMGGQNMEKVKNSFRAGGAFRENVGEFFALSVWERLRNILIAEFKKGSYMPQITAIDPASENERQNDIIMLQNRHLLEGPMTQLGTRVNRPPFKLDKKNFSSNVEQFDEMGLNSSSPQDLSFFRKVYQRLDHEIACSEIVQALFKYNEFEEYIEDLVNDILAKKAVAYQVYESPMSGEMKWRYLKPETVSWVKGKRRTGKDAAAIQYNINVTVREFMEMSSGWFDFNNDNHQQMLMQAVRHGGAGHDWERISYAGATNAEGEIVCSFSGIQAQVIELGYIEWKTVDGIAKKVHKTNGISYPMEYGDDLSVNSIYKKEVTEIQETYKSFYVATSTYDQWMWNYGPLYHTLTEGDNDEYSNFTFCIWTGTGKTAVQVSEPLIDIVNYAFYKMWWGIYESTPNKEVYSAEGLYNLLSMVGAQGPSQQPTGVGAGRLGNQPQLSTANLNQLTNLISFMKDSLVRVYAAGDKSMGGDGKPYFIEQGGIDPVAVAMQSVVDWGEAKISALIGMNALREGYTPDPKDGYKLGVEATKQSRNATYYIPEAIGYLMKTNSEKSLMLSQDCIALGGKGKNFILKLVGKDTVTTMTSLEKVGIHRYGMFVNVQNSEDIRQEIKQEAQAAYIKGDIQYHEYLLIKEVGDVKKAAMTLAFFKERGMRIEQQQKALEHKRAMELKQMDSDGKIAIENTKGQWELQKMDRWGEWYMRAHQIPADAALQKKQMEIEHESDKQQFKADGKVKEIQANASAQAQAALPSAPPVISDQSSGA
jgi:hypothetical protein